MFSRQTPQSRGTQSFYEQLRSEDDNGFVEDRAGIDEENLRENFNEFDAEGLSTGDSRITVDSVALDMKENHRTGPGAAARTHNTATLGPRWPIGDDELDNDVPASLLVEPNEGAHALPAPEERAARLSNTHQPTVAGPSSARSQAQWEAATRQQRLHRDDVYSTLPGSQPRPLARGMFSGGAKEKALWRWVNTSNLDRFMRDVYDYYEGGGLWCILSSNALWLL